MNHKRTKSQDTMFKRCFLAVCVCSLLLCLPSCQKYKSTLLSNDKSWHASIFEANTFLPLPSTHELNLTHDDKHIYLFSQEGFFIILDPVGEKVHLIDRSNDEWLFKVISKTSRIIPFNKLEGHSDEEVLINEVKLLQGTPLVFNDKLVIDTITNSRIGSISSTFLSIPSFDLVSSTDIIFHNTPQLVTENNVYRIGSSVYGHWDIRITTQDASGKVLWLYPKGPTDEIADIPFFFLDLYEKNGILHLIQAYYSKESLYHVAIASSTGQILLEEKIGEYDPEAWWESMSLYYPGKRVLWTDEAVVIQAHDRHGVYLARFSLNDDLSLEEQWKQYYSDAPYKEDSFPVGTHNAGITKLGTEKEWVLMPLWKEKNDMGYVFDLYCIEQNTGRTLWKAEDQVMRYKMEFYEMRDTLVMKTDFPEENCLNAFSLSTGRSIQKTQLSPPGFNKELWRSSTIDAFHHEHWYSFDEQSLILTKVNPLKGSNIKTKLKIKEKIEQAHFIILQDQLFLLCKTSKDTLHNCLIYRVDGLD